MGRIIRPVLVTTRSFNEPRDVGDPVSQAKIYEAQLADELIVLNIDGNPIGSDTVMLGLIERLASETFMPLCVGGGVRTLQDFDTLLNTGADKISINAAALASPDLINSAAQRYGSQCVVVSIDFRKSSNGEYLVAYDRAERTTGRTVLAWAREAVERGAGELLLCDADRDGMGTGMNCEVGHIIANAVRVPTILSGGCGRAEHFVEGFTTGGAEGVAAGTFFAFRDQNPMQARAHIRNANIPIRMEV
ncbi:Imidazole glycerol phosphate synthase subunit HisF OS=Eoetvoesiella caeni OX=645616 GN=hisF PE=3 SV=1 [Eoetvoesiella caeni]